MAALTFFFFFHGYGHPRDLHSFPTRRSSDLALSSDGAVPSRLRKLCTWPAGALRGSPASMTRTERQDLASATAPDRKSTRLNSSHSSISYAVFCLKKKKKIEDKNAHDCGAVA